MAPKKINLKNITKYGFDNDIIQDMIKYEIMFKVETRTDAKGKKDYFVYEDEVVFFLNRMLKNTMKVYEVTEEVNKKAEEVKKLMEQAPTLTEMIKKENNQ